MADSVATDTLGSIVLVATSAWKVGTLSDNTGAREAAQTKLHSLMSKIFSQPSGRAWVRAHLPARYPDDQIRWASDEQAAERIRELTEEVVAAGVDARRRIDGGETLTMINEYRVLLDRKRFVALATTVGAANEIGAGGGPTASLAWLVSLDFRFYVTSGEAPEELRCSVLISVLSAAPRSGRYRPHDLDAERDHDEPHIRTSSLDTYRLDFTGVAAGGGEGNQGFLGAQ
jgi:hypothetical protein